MMREIEVVGGVLVSDGTIMCCRRAPGRTAAGRWEFPGGKIDPGETPEGALIRELSEELSIDVTVSRLLDRSVTVVDDTRIDLACYFISELSGLPTASTDHDAIQWLAPHELGEVDWAQPDIPAVRRLRDGEPLHL